MRTIGVVIVTWNSGATIDRCLDSCSGLTVTVVDNASRDDTVERVRRRPDIYLIANSENRGFAAAANQGVARSSCETVLLLNPDVELCGGVKELADACALPETAIAAGRLLGVDGSTQTGFTVRRLPTPLTLAFEVCGINWFFPRNRVNRSYRCLDLDAECACDVEQPAGAFIMFRQQMWRDLGGFDEQFFPVWFEDVDFARRAGERGRIRYLPSVTARHQGGASIARLDWTSRERYWYGSLLRYASKHFRTSEFRGVCGAVVLGSVFRSLIGVFKQRTLKSIAVYAGVVNLASRSLFFGRMQGPALSQGVQQGNRVRTITSNLD